MMALDDLRSRAMSRGFNHIGIKRALTQVSEFLVALWRNPRSYPMNCRPMILRFCSGSLNAFELGIKIILAVERRQVHAHRLELLLNPDRFIFAQEAVVDEYGVNLFLAQGLGQKHGGHSGIDATRYGHEDFALADVLTDLLHGRVEHLARIPVAGAWQISKTKAFSRSPAMFGMLNLRVKLQADPGFFAVSDDGDDLLVGMGRGCTKDSSGSSTSSPWLIQTICSLGRVRRYTHMPAGLCNQISDGLAVLPFLPLRILPPEAPAMSCMP